MSKKLKRYYGKASHTYSASHMMPVVELKVNSHITKSVCITKEEYDKLLRARDLVDSIELISKNARFDSDIVNAVKALFTVTK